MREAMDGLYELFLVRDANLALYQGIFNTFPNIQEWSMNDSYSRHPDPAKGFLYMYQGRKDDIIVLSNGEKIAPALMEATLMSDPLVKGAMIVGRGKFQPAALIDLAEEPPRSVRQRHQMIERLLPVLAEANEHAPGHGKLDQYHIFFADPKRPVRYLGQGKLQRHSTHNLYEKDIEEVYIYADDANEQFGYSDFPSLDFTSKASVIQWLKQLIAEIGNVPELDMDQNLFEAGIDSLHVIKIARELRFQARRAGLGKAGVEVFLPTSIYSHPTLRQLVAFILRQNGCANGNQDGSPDGITNGHMNNHVNGHIRSLIIEKMQALLHAFADSLPCSSQASPPPSTEKNMIVVVTGSTGSLGSYLLEALYHDQRVSHIICLNRSFSASEKHRQTGPKRGLSFLNPDRVEFHKADLSQPQLGLESSVYARMLKTVTHVIRKFQRHLPRLAYN